MATWSPELLLIRPIRGETGRTPETGRDVLWPPGRKSPQVSFSSLTLAQKYKGFSASVIN